MDFLTSSKKVHSDLNHLETYISELDRNMKIKQNSILSKNEEENLDMRINAIVTTFTDLSDDIKIRLQETRKETEKITKKPEKEVFSALFGIKICTGGIVMPNLRYR